MLPPPLKAKIAFTVVVHKCLVDLGEGALLQLGRADDADRTPVAVEHNVLIAHAPGGLPT